MKRLIKKNQVIVAALALMIAAAGYLNYSGKLFESTDDSGVSQQANSELLDISEEDIETGSGDIESQDQDAFEETGRGCGRHPGRGCADKRRGEKYGGSG